MKKEILPDYLEDIAITNYVPGQVYFDLPGTVKNPIKIVEVYNSKKNKWEIVPFSIVLRIDRKKLKTDKDIKIHYDANRSV